MNDDKVSGEKSPKSADLKSDDAPAGAPSAEVDPVAATKPTRRGVEKIVLIGVIAIAAAIYLYYRVDFGGVPTPSAQVAAIGGPFTLTDHTGKVVTERDFRGKFMLLTFGYTYCPDVCPTSLSKMAMALDLIGEAAAAVTPVFISIDPARDTPEHLNEYVGFFHPRLRGLTGTPAQVAAAAKAFRIYFAKVKPDPGADPDDYMMDHSALTYLIGPDGEFKAYFSYSVDAKEMALRVIEFLP